MERQDEDEKLPRIVFDPMQLFLETWIGGGLPDVYSDDPAKEPSPTSETAADETL